MEKIKKVLLVNTYEKHIQRRLQILGGNHQPLGILYIASVLENNGINVKISDELVGQKTEKIISDFNPDIIGLSVRTPAMDRAKKIITYAKKNEFKVVLGGPHPSALPLQTIQECNADAVIVGEGEYSMLEICQRRNWKNVNGVLVRNKKSFKPRSPIYNIDSLPFPSRHLLDLNKYNKTPELGFNVRKNEQWASMLASRGCPFLCTYCASNKVFGRKTRFRSPENILKEMQQLHENGTESIIFVDDTFTLNPEYTKKLCELINKNDIRIRWACQTRFPIEKTLLELMKKSGCEMISIGVESGSNKILRNIKKGTNTKSIINGFKKIKAAGIKTKAYFMIGLPEENKKEFLESVNLIEKINPDYLWVSFFSPLPGSTIFNEMNTKMEWKKYTFFTTDDKILQNRFITMLKKYYLNPKRLFRNVTFLKNFIEQII